MIKMKGFLLENNLTAVSILLKLELDLSGAVPARSGTRTVPTCVFKIVLKTVSAHQQASVLYSSSKCNEMFPSLCNKRAFYNVPQFRMNSMHLVLNLATIHF